MIRYCKKCVMPNTKPDLYLDEFGVCNACRSYESRKEIDWQVRKEQLFEILDKHRSKNGSNYDCIIPVSGGKDSTFQVLKMLEFGMNPLCVTASTCSLSDLGRKNIENLKSFGVDYVEITPNPIIRKKINKLALMQVGDISWPEHVSIFTAPIRIAVQMGISLVIWGENSQNEFGGPLAAAENNVKNRRWMEEFGGLLGLRVSDLIGQEGIEAKHLIQYTYPSDEELKRIGVTGLFLGYYIPWDGFSNVLLSQIYGFQTYNKPTEGSLVNYENLDNYFHGIHDYFKFIKYAFGRATDQACLHIRRGRLSRQDGLNGVMKLDGKYPHVYLGKSLESMLDSIDMNIDEFNRTCDKFTNKKLFKCDNQGNLLRDKYYNLIKVNYDNIE